MVRKGRPPEFVRGRDGKEIHGLSAQAIKNEAGEPVGYRHYATFSKPRVWFGTYPTKDDPVAIMEFRRWESQQTGEKVTVCITKPITRDQFGTGNDDYSGFVINPDGSIESEIGISADDFWRAVREAILSDKGMVADRTGIPAIARLDQLPQRKPAFSLKAAGDLYFDTKSEDCHREGIASVKKWWAEFVDILDGLEKPARTIDDLNHDVLIAYAKQIRADENTPSKKTGKPRGSSYRRSRFNAVTTILNYAYECRKLSEDQIARLRADWNIPLKRPPARRGKKIIITPTEFKGMLDAATQPYDRAMLLLGVNCCFYPVDFAVEWDHINLAEGTLTYRRAKKNERGIEGTTRVAVLWKQTVKALKDLKRTTSYVFATSGGIPPHRTEVLRRIQKLVKDAALARMIRAEDLRNTAATIASRNAPSTQYRVMMGHTLPSEDSGYIEANPFYVADACKAIGNYLGIE